MKSRPRKASEQGPLPVTADDVVERPIDSIRPSPENDRLYRPIDPRDPSIVALAQDIEDRGMDAPILVSADGWIISGHRRYAAARLAGLLHVPTRTNAVVREDDPDTFVRLLVEANRHNRIKSVAEIAREEAVALDPEAEHRAYIKARNPTCRVSQKSIRLSKRQARAEISAAKRPMLDAVLQVLSDLKADWPLSDRSIHYRLLNVAPLRHASKPNSTYANDRNSYGDLCDLLTRARLARIVPWEAICDDTRPLIQLTCFDDPQPYIRGQLSRLFRSYYRNYQQSQPAHIEILAEKLTLRGILEKVALEYCIPLTIGRGYCSINPRRELAERFRRSSKSSLVLLIISDFDPDGENIAESFARSMRDDFGIKSIHPIKVGLTYQQVKTLKLPPNKMRAKIGSSKYTEFVRRYGKEVYEVEALSPDLLRRILRDEIEQVMDIRLYNAEVEREKSDVMTLAEFRRAVQIAITDAYPDISMDD